VQFPTGIFTRKTKKAAVAVANEAKRIAALTNAATAETLITQETL
jgi:hypothetical protein